MSSDTRTAPSIPADVRALLDAPKYVHLATLRADGSPRNHVVWVGLEGDHVLVCTSDVTWKAGDIRRDPRVALSVVDLANPTAWRCCRAGWSRSTPTKVACR